MEFYMKKILTFLLPMAVILSGCSSKETAAENITNIESSSTVDTALAGETFLELPDSGLDSLNLAAKCSKEIFPDADGDWMYGYKGAENLGGDDCYVFAVYTYKDGIHIKEGELAVSEDCADVYLRSKITGDFGSVPSLPKKEQSWAETKTLAFVN